MRAVEFPESRFLAVKPLGMASLGGRMTRHTWVELS